LEHQLLLSDILLILSAAFLSNNASAAGVTCAAQANATYPTIVKEIETFGIVGELHTPVGCTTKNVVITLGGSEGGVPSDMADSFAKRGVTTLALGYFGAGGLPPALDEIPLETVQNAMLAMPKVAPGTNCCVIIGFSKGAEGALAFASVAQPDLLGLILVAPSDRAFGGLGKDNAPTGNSGWTYKSLPISYTPYATANDSLLAQMFPKGFEKPPVLKPFYEATMALPSGGSGLYAVDRVLGPILILSGKDDHLWPSSNMAENIVSGAKASGFRFNLESYSYANAGHLVIGGVDFLSADSYNRVWLGGNVEGSKAAETDAWEKIAVFLNRIFQSLPRSHCLK
jgi:hypothetical protein